MVAGTPPGDALPPPPQRATPARKGARSGASAGSRRPHRPHPGHTARGTLAARSRGRGAGGGTAPDTRRPSQWWKAAPPPPGDALPPPPQRATPARKGVRCGAGAGSPRPHRPHPEHRGRGSLAARSRGRAAGGGTAPDTRRPSQRWLASPPRGRPPNHPRGTQPPQGMQAKGTVLGPHTHTPAPTARGWRTPTARPVGGQSGEGERLTSDAPHNGGWHPPRDALPPPPQRATPARKGARCGASAGSPRRHRPQPGHTGRRTLAARFRGRAARGGTAPDTRRPSQWWKAPPLETPFRHPHSEQRRPAKAHAVAPVLGPHARTDGTRDTRVAEPRPPAPEGGRLGEGQRLTPDAPQNGGRPPPPGTAPHHPRGTQPPQGMQTKGSVLGPHIHTPATTACGWRTPTARPVGGQLGEGERLTTDAPHNGGRHPPGGRPSATPTASNAGPQGRTLWDRCWVPRPHRPHPGHTGRGTPAARPRGPAAGGGTAPDTRRPSQRWQATPPGDGPPPPPWHAAPTGHAGKGTVLGPHTHTPAPTARGWRTPTARPVGGQSGEGERLTSDALAMAEGTPPGDALPQPPQRATPANKGACCGAGAGSPRSHRPQPGHTGRGTPAARPRGRAAGGGTAPDTRRPSQRWQAITPGDGRPPPPRHAAPTGHAGQGDSVGPPHPHTRAHSTWVADPNSPPSGRAVRGGGAPDLRRPSQRWKASPPGTPFRHPHSEQRRPARVHAVEPVLGPYAHTDRTRNTQVAVPRLPAPEDGRSGGGTAPDTRRPSQQWQATPPRGRHPTTPAARSPRRACRPGQVGGNRDRTATPPARQTEQGTGAGHAEVHGPRGTALPAPSAGTARGAHATPPRGGGSGRCGSASAHTRKGHAGTTRRATGPSSRNAQTAWNGVPASEGKGHPDETARHKQRGTRGAGRGKRERQNTRHRPEPPDPAASAAHTRTGHCTRQGSSGALRHAPAPRLGSLCASPRGSHWRQASSTGLAAPAPWATTY